VTFDIYPAEPVAALPRPWLPPRWRSGLKIPLLVALAIGLLMLMAHLIPADPRALSLDTIDRTNRMLAALVIPLEVNAPAVDRARDLQKSGGIGAPAAPKPSGQAGDRKARQPGRLAMEGKARPEDARAAAARVRANTLLAVLDGPRGGALQAVFDDGPAMGADPENVVGNLIASNAGPGYGVGSFGLVGTGAGAGGEHEGTVGGGGPLGTTGRFGGHGGTRYGLGPTIGGLGTHHTIVPDPRIGIVHVSGTLDKEIIRRTVRRHLNEVKYCYEQALVTRPSLSGRVVIQFAIAPTGRVLTSVLQSSSLGVAAVDNCVVNAVKRWEFPEPERGGLAMVSYPFTFSPAGN
jgi:TonB family protein